ncbi:MAG: hypothetical protein K5978_08325 [Campylobacter sp.]|nr:hypothetical protein [Campylobacter sp.]
MSFSFIKPELRPIFSLFSKLWFFLIGLLFIFLFIINIFLIFKNMSLDEQSQLLSQERTRLNNNIVFINELSAEINDKIEIAKGIYTSNNLLKQSLNNLFDLVPDSITLEELVMDKKSLIIRGITPTKAVFNQLLASPLKSIFNTSNTSFYQIKNGWYGFISTNKMENSEGYNE